MNRLTEALLIVRVPWRMTLRRNERCVAVIDVWVIWSETDARSKSSRFHIPQEFLLLPWGGERTCRRRIWIHFVEVQENSMVTVAKESLSWRNVQNPCNHLKPALMYWTLYYSFNYFPVCAAIQVTQLMRIPVVYWRQNRSEVQIASKTSRRFLRWQVSGFGAAWTQWCSTSVSQNVGLDWSSESVLKSTYTLYLPVYSKKCIGNQQ